jgi:hypothetical protein
VAAFRELPSTVTRVFLTYCADSVPDSLQMVGATICDKLDLKGRNLRSDHVYLIDENTGRRPAGY